MAEQYLSKETLILVASVGKGHSSMTDSLHRHGYFRLIPLTHEGDIGYEGETLETLYFMYNKDRLHVAHAGFR